MGAYEATLLTAGILALKEKRRVKVFLTSLGGGAFGNMTVWITDAIKRALAERSNLPLDVYLVHYGNVQSSVAAALPAISIAAAQAKCRRGVPSKEEGSSNI